MVCVWLCFLNQSLALNPSADLVKSIGNNGQLLTNELSSLCDKFDFMKNIRFTPVVKSSRTSSQGIGAFVCAHAGATTTKSDVQIFDEAQVCA